jgi:hypothetical protein
MSPTFGLMKLHFPFRDWGMTVAHELHFGQIYISHH